MSTVANYIWSTISNYILSTIANYIVNNVNSTFTNNHQFNRVLSLSLTSSRENCNLTKYFTVPPHWDPSLHSQRTVLAQVKEITVSTINPRHCSKINQYCFVCSFIISKVCCHLQTLKAKGVKDKMVKLNPDFLFQCKSDFLTKTVRLMT